MFRAVYLHNLNKSTKSLMTVSSLPLRRSTGSDQSQLVRYEMVPFVILRTSIKQRNDSEIEAFLILGMISLEYVDHNVYNAIPFYGQQYIVC